MNPTGPHVPLRRYFAGLTEYTFHAQLGVADPRLIDYITELLLRFATFEAMHSVKNQTGRSLQEVTAMLMEAETRSGEPCREIHRHIGDFTLFWTGVYPEMLDRLKKTHSPDAFLDYTQQGKRSYHIAATIPSQQGTREADILERLSEQFELCAFGLHELRKEWDRRETS